MRGENSTQGHMFTYLSPEQRIMKDPTHSYGSREEAEVARLEFGRRMIGHFGVPAYGDGDLQGEASG